MTFPSSSAPPPKKGDSFATRQPQGELSKGNISTNKNTNSRTCTANPAFLEKRHMVYIQIYIYILLFI